MKNQLDLIIAGVCVFLGLVVAGVCFATKPVAAKQNPPAQVVLTPPQLPGADVKYANSLPGAGGSSGGGMGGGSSVGMGGGNGQSSGPSGTRTVNMMKKGGGGKLGSMGG